jgi:plasmid replication initiation protein
MVELRELLGVPLGTYRDWTDLSRKTLTVAKAEIDHIAPFTLTWHENRRGRAVVGVELRFDSKRPEAIKAASEELKNGRAGRKVRRDELAKVEATPSRAQMDLMEALNALRDGQPPPGTR